MGMMTRLRPAAVLVPMALASLTAACGAEADAPVSHSTETSVRVAEESGQQRFDPLVIKLTLRSERVASGKSVRSRMDVQNPSAESVIDPSCLIGGGRYALVPAHDADAELWIQPAIDCRGPFEIKPGFRDHWWGPSFPARTKSGAPLPRGKYLAVLEIEGLSKRLEYPVTVE